MFSNTCYLGVQINISQKEYEEKYRLYLERLNGAATAAAAGAGRRSRRRRNSPGMMSSPHSDDKEETEADDDAEEDEDEDDDETDLHIMHTFRPSEYPHITHFPRGI